MLDERESLLPSMNLNCLNLERLWISSLTEKAILKGFENLKSGKDFDSLHDAGVGRSRADWLVGISMRRKH
jgi:DNA topoisomerase-3